MKASHSLGFRSIGWRTANFEKAAQQFRFTERGWVADQPRSVIRDSQRIHSHAKAQIGARHCPRTARSPGFSRLERENRLKPELHACQNENCCDHLSNAPLRGCPATPGSAILFLPSFVAFVPLA